MKSTNRPCDGEAFLNQIMEEDEQTKASVWEAVSAGSGSVCVYVDSGRRGTWTDESLSLVTIMVPLRNHHRYLPGIGKFMSRQSLVQNLSLAPQLYGAFEDSSIVVAHGPRRFAIDRSTLAHDSMYQVAAANAPKIGISAIT